MGMTLGQRLRAATRAFKFGADLDWSDMAFGKADEDYSPAEYGDYIATSNGVYACANLRAEMLSSLPLRLYRRSGDDANEVTAGPLRELLDRVNPFWTFNRLISMTELSLCLWGESYWVLDRGVSGGQPPREIWWCRPDKMRVVPHQTDYISGYLYYPSKTAQPIPFSAGEVLWLRYPNPLDEFAGLSPLAAARLAADSASAAMKSNRNIFANGLQAGGIVLPPDNLPNGLTVEQRDELQRLLNRQFKGVENAHRWGIFRHQFKIEAMPQVTPQDAEFSNMLKLALEDICRAYRVPLDLLGGQRSYENVQASEAAMWGRCLIPESRFVAAELTEQLVPLFPGVDYAEFDTSEVTALQADENLEWQRASDQIQRGAITINEWRTEQGLEPVPWGDEPPRVAPPFGAAPAGGDESDADQQPDDESAPDDTDTTDDTERSRAAVPGLEYNGVEHQRIWNRFAKRSDRWEERVADAMADLFRRQRTSVIAKLKAQKEVSPAALSKAFDRPQWIKTSRSLMRPLIKQVMQDFGDEALSDLAGMMPRGKRDQPVQQVLDFAQSEAARFLERRAQRFAKQVTATTWDDLKRVLGPSADAGESMAELAARVEDLFTGYYHKTGETEMLAKSSRAFTIARTEVLGASNGGALIAWEQSEVVESKTWVAALDQATRESHVVAHGQTVPLRADFVLDGGAGPAPGQIGNAGEDINCRCTMIAGLKP